MSIDHTLGMTCRLFEERGVETLTRLFVSQESNKKQKKNKQGRFTQSDDHVCARLMHVIADKENKNRNRKLTKLVGSPSQITAKPESFRAGW